MMEMMGAERTQPTSDRITQQTEPRVSDDVDGANGRKGPASLGVWGGGAFGPRKPETVFTLDD